MFLNLLKEVNCLLPMTKPDYDLIYTLNFKMKFFDVVSVLISNFFFSSHYVSLDLFMIDFIYQIITKTKRVIINYNKSIIED